MRACAAVGLSRATAYRQLGPKAGKKATVRQASHRRIPEPQRSEILAVLDSERFIDQPPREVFAAILSEGRYLCSWRTMYRLLRARGIVRERRNQREPRHRAVPRLVAAAPNAIWTWDIERHEALLNRAVMKGHRQQVVAAACLKLRAAGHVESDMLGGKQP